MSEIPRPNPEAYKDAREPRERITTFEIKDSKGRMLATCESTITAPDKYGESKLLRCVLTSPNGTPVDLLELPDGRADNIRILFNKDTSLTDYPNFPGIVLVNRDLTNIADIVVLLHELGHEEQYYSSDGFSETWKASTLYSNLREDYSRRFKDLASKFSNLLTYHEMHKRSIPVRTKMTQEAENEFDRIIAKFYEVFKEDKRQSDHIKIMEGREYLDDSDEDVYTEDHKSSIEELNAYTQEFLWRYPDIKEMKSDRILWFEKDASDRVRRRLILFAEQGIDLQSAVFPLTEREVASAKEALTHKSKVRREAAEAYLRNPNKTISERLDFAYGSYECIHAHTAHE